MEYRRLDALYKDTVEIFLEHWSGSQMAIRGQFFDLLNNEGVAALEDQKSI